MIIGLNIIYYSLYILRAIRVTDARECKFSATFVFPGSDRDIYVRSHTRHRITCRVNLLQ